MTTEALSAGFYQRPDSEKKVPKIQIFTVEELMHGKEPDIPLVDEAAFKRAAKEDKNKQGKPL